MFQEFGATTDDRNLAKFTPVKAVKYVDRKKVEKVGERKVVIPSKNMETLRVIPIYETKSFIVQEVVEEMPCDLIPETGYSYLTNN